VNEHDIDEIFSLLENPVRRKILRLLAMETHYPLQLSRELGISQQSIGNHIKILEDHGLVRSYEMPSSIGGPPRKIYVPNFSFSLHVDMGPDIFETRLSKRRFNTTIFLSEPGQRENIHHVMREKSDAQKNVSSEDHIQETASSVKSNSLIENKFEQLRTMDQEIDELEKKRMAIIDDREELLAEVTSILWNNIPDYLNRKLIYYLLEQGPTSIEEMSDIFDKRIKELEKIQNMIRDQYDLRWLFQP